MELHKDELNKLTKDELIEKYIKGKILSKNHPRFTLDVIKHGPHHLTVTKSGDRYIVVHKVYNYGKGEVESYVRMKYNNDNLTGRQVISGDVNVIREREDYSEYLKQFGL